MQTVRGDLTDVGPGSWSNGSTVISLLRMGGRTFRKIVASDDMHHFLNPGNVEELYLHRLALPFFGRQLVLGLRKKDGGKETMSMTEILGSSLAFILQAIILGPVLGLILGCLFLSVIVGVSVSLAVVIWAIATCASLTFALFRVKVLQ